MNVGKLHAMLAVSALLLAACQSQPTPPQAAEAPSKTNAQATTAAAGNTAPAEDTGPFRKTVRGGKTVYCDPSPRTGTRMSKPYCLTQAQFDDWKEKNAALKEDMHRGSVGITTDNRNPGPR